MNDHNEKFEKRQDKLKSEIRDEDVFSPILHKGNDILVDN